MVLKAITFHGATPYVLVTYAGKSYLLKTGDDRRRVAQGHGDRADDGTATFQLGDQTFDLHIGQSFVDCTVDTLASSTTKAPVIRPGPSSCSGGLHAHGETTAVGKVADVKDSESCCAG